MASGGRYAYAGRAPEELDLHLASIEAGETDPWVYVATGELAARLGQWPLALECLKRVDPLGRPAEVMREKLEELESGHRVPGPPAGLAHDPGEVVAGAFLAGFSRKGMAPLRDQKVVVELGGFVVAAVLAIVLPAPLYEISLHALSAAFLCWLVPLGLRVGRGAWYQPGAEKGHLADALSHGRFHAYGVQAVALLAVAGPLALGFLAGLGWSLLLTPVTTLLSLLILMSEPQRELRTGFPFASPPNTREWCALGFGALMICAGGFLAALFLRMQLFGAIGYIVFAFFTWNLANRCAGLLSRRIHLRVQAEHRAHEPLCLVPSGEDPDVTRPSHAMLEPRAPVLSHDDG